MKDGERPSRRQIVRLGAAGALGTMASLGTPMFLPARAAETSGSIPINIVIIAGNNSNVLQTLIDQQGYLEQFGVAATVLAVSDGTKATSALVSGAADICTGSGISQVLPAIENGGSLKIVAGTAALPLTAIYSSNPDVKSTKDLIGRTVGVGAPGALLHQLMVALLSKKGLDYSKVKFVNIGSSSDVVRAIVAGTVDAGVGDYELYEQQSKFGIHSLSDGDLWSELPEFVNQGACVSDQGIRGKREGLVRTLAAYAKTFQFLQGPQSKEAYLKARATTLPKDSPGGGEAQWNFYQKYQPYLKTLTLSEERMKYMQDLNVLLGVQKKLLPFDQIADFSLAQDALKRLS
jgi:ABC-type nitrate/sulfonate/bicarbonate transport system substrate-binding protein